MSNPKCGKCAKTVYPLELMAGAGKSWHKGCFKCHHQGCNTTLTLKNFKAHAGEVWCAVHYPPLQTEVKSFKSEKQADSGTFENEAASSATDAGGAWGGGKADAGEYANEPTSYQQEGGYDANQGGYADQGGYDQGGYAEGGEQYNEGY